MSTLCLMSCGQKYIYLRSLPKQTCSTMRSKTGKGGFGKRAQLTRTVIFIDTLVTLRVRFTKLVVPVRFYNPFWGPGWGYPF